MTLRCERCGEPIESDDQDEQVAREELAKNFPGESVEGCGVVCDGCYALIMRAIRS